MLCEYAHTKSESLAQICTTMAEIQHFSRELFLLAHHVHYQDRILPFSASTTSLKPPLLSDPTPSESIERMDSY